MADTTSSPEEFNPKEKRKFWEGHIQAWQQSGLTQVEYCRDNKLKNHQLWYWRKRISHPSDTDVTFVPLRFSSSKISQAGTLCMPFGGLDGTIKIQCQAGQAFALESLNYD